MAAHAGALVRALRLLHHDPIAWRPHTDGGPNAL
jgi:hypothetical protein